MFTPGLIPVNLPQQDPAWLARVNPPQPTGYFDRFGAESAISWFKSPLHEIYNLNLMRAVLNDVDQESISQQEWQGSAYYRPGLQYVPGMPWEYARLLAEEHDRMNYYSGIIERGPKGLVAFGVGMAGSLAGGIPDPINFIPVAGVGFRSTAQFTRLASRYGIQNQFLTRALKGAADVGLATAIVQPTMSAAASEFQEDYDLAVLSSNLGFSIAMGFGFGAANAGIHRWSQNRIVAALRKAAADDVSGKPINVAPALKEVPGEPVVPDPQVKPIPDPVTPEVLPDTTPVDRVANWDDATFKKFDAMVPETAWGKRLQGLITKIKDVRDMVREIGPESKAARELSDEIVVEINRNPLVVKALGDLDTMKDAAVSKTLDDIKSFGTYGVPVQTVFKGMATKQIKEVSEPIHRMVIERVKSLKEDIDQAESPKLIVTGEAGAKEYRRTKSTWPLWAQELHSGNQPKAKRLTKKQRAQLEVAKAQGIYKPRRKSADVPYAFSNYGTLVEAIGKIIEGTDDEIIPGKGAASLKRTIETVRSRAIEDITEGASPDPIFDSWFLELHEELVGGHYEPHPEVMAELARLNGDIPPTITPDPRMMVLPEEVPPELPPLPNEPVFNTEVEKAMSELATEQETTTLLMEEMKRTEVAPVEKPTIPEDIVKVDTDIKKVKKMKVITKTLADCLKGEI